MAYHRNKRLKKVMLGEVSTQYLILIICILVLRLFDCMSLGFIVRGHGLAAPSAGLSRATLLENKKNKAGIESHSPH